MKASAAGAPPGRAAASAVGRADLLRLLARARPAAGDIDAVARLLGFEHGARDEAPAPPPPTGPETGLEQREPPAPPPPPAPGPTAALPNATFFVATRLYRIADDAGPGTWTPPAWLAGAQVLERDEAFAPPAPVPAAPPLAPWARLWPVLRRVLGELALGREPDLRRVLRDLSGGRPLRRVPMLRRRRWAPQAALLVDYHARCTPFHDDYNRLRRALLRLRGSAGLAIDALIDDPQRTPYVRSVAAGRDPDACRRWTPPAPGAALLIVSDLGLYDPSGVALAGWLAFGRHLRALGSPAAVLCPVPAPLVPARLCALYRVYAWDRDSPLRVLARADAPGVAAAVFGAPAERAAKRLMALLAPALVAEPADVRTLRYRLGAGEATAAVEALLWRRESAPASPAGDAASWLDHVKAGDQGLWIADVPALQMLRRAFVEETDDRLRAQAVEVLRRRHAGWPASMRYAEFEDIDHLLAEAGADPRADPRDDWLAPGERRAFEDWKRDIVETLRRRDDLPGLQRWAAADIGRQDTAHAPAWSGDPQRAARWALVQRQRLRDDPAGALQVPRGVDAGQVLAFVQRESSAGVGLRVVQRGQRLWGISGAATAAPREFELAVCPGHRGTLGVEALGGSGGAARSWLVPAAAERVELPLRLDRALRSATIATRTHRLTIEATTLAAWPWAEALRRDARGLHAEGPPWRGRPAELHWQPPADGVPGRWSGADDTTELGVDRYGLYALLRVGAARQRFRWIMPGTFLMGSPPDEAERGDNETLHEVRLTRGYWLADTATTQALWVEVMGHNPSRFTGDDRLPVENVSWDDVQAFIAKVNEHVPGLDARLPTEAQWEYACRAGTRTPFSLGPTITPERVNYNGNYPYGGVAEGEFRRRTVPAGSLPANDWGLHEMHGNVWEWCSDWYGEYPREAVTDPAGPGKGSGRVLRGGSWFNGAGLARSARRIADGPGGRDGVIGFRLAPGPGQPAERADRQGPAQPGGARGTRAPPARPEPGIFDKLLDKLGKRKR